MDDLTQAALKQAPQETQLRQFMLRNGVHSLGDLAKALGITEIELTTSMKEGSVDLSDQRVHRAAS